MAGRVAFVAERFLRHRASRMHLGSHLSHRVCSSDPVMKILAPPPNAAVKFIHGSPDPKISAAMLSRLERRLWDLEQVKVELQRMETRYTKFRSVAAKICWTIENVSMKRLEESQKRLDERFNTKGYLISGDLIGWGLVMMLLGYLKG